MAPRRILKVELYYVSFSLLLLVLSFWFCNMISLYSPAWPGAPCVNRLLLNS